MKLVKPLHCISLLAFITMNAVMAESPRQFPEVAGKDLNNKPWVAPVGFPAERTLVVIGFEEEQQTGIDTWLEGMGVHDTSTGIAWIEMPLIKNPGLVMRWIINSGMRGGIPSKSIRSHVWTAYTDKKAFMEACGMKTEQAVYVLVVNRQGKILAMEYGDFNREAGERLKRVIKG